jgi:hypothetical protein
MSSPKFGSERLIICDASPLILLAKVAQLDLVSAFAKEVWIPESVWSEITAPPRRPEMVEIERRFSRAIKKADGDIQATFSLMVDEGRRECSHLPWGKRMPVFSWMTGKGARLQRRGDSGASARSDFSFGPNLTAGSRL